ncbi:hypothetical protein ACFVXR_30145 [Bacillus thuringiensis]|uniref:hypothetical protein n=1 Tax=Bacillus TaxID=1386 RepID=UPI00077AB6C4|nr:hypothetical protein AT261_05470 [Bacillus cereus]
MNIIMHDIKNIFRKNLNKWILWFGCLIMLTIISIANLKITNQQNSILDLWFLLFEGVKNNQQSFYIPPFSWLLIQIFLAYLMGDYVFKELKENSFYTLIKSQSRLNWFLGKIIWIIGTVSLFYFTIIIILIFSSFWLDLNFTTWGEYSNYTFDSNLTKLTNPINFFLLFLLSCFITSLLISIIQVILTLLIKPIYSFCIIVSILLASIYFSSSLLISKYLMAIHFATFFKNGIFEGVNIFTYEIISFIFITFLGYKYFNKMNLI